MTQAGGGGEKLKQIRLEKGLSLEEAQKKTKIHLSILKALEGDSLTDLSPVYLKGFLKIYCKFLGVEPKDYIGDYKEPQPLSIPEVKGGMTSIETAKFKLLAFVSSAKARRILAAIAIVLFISAALFNLGKRFSLRGKQRLKQAELKPPSENKKNIKAKAPKEPQIKVSSVKEGAKPVLAVKAPILAKEKEQLAKAAASGIILTISARENSMVKVKVDGRLIFQRVLEKGRSETWQAKEKIEVDLGNAGAVEVQVNEKRFPSLGRRGQALKGILITKDGLKTL